MAEMMRVSGFLKYLCAWAKSDGEFLHYALLPPVCSAIVIKIIFAATGTVAFGAPLFIGSLLGVYAIFAATYIGIKTWHYCKENKMIASTIKQHRQRYNILADMRAAGLVLVFMPTLYYFLGALISIGIGFTLLAIMFVPSVYDTMKEYTRTNAPQEYEVPAPQPRGGFRHVQAIFLTLFVSAGLCFFYGGIAGLMIGPLALLAGATPATILAIAIPACITAVGATIWRLV